MPGKSKSQVNFFKLVRWVQSGKIPKDKVSSDVRKAAKNISSKDAHDFASTPLKNLPTKVKKEVLKILKEIRDAPYLNEDQVQINPIAKKFNQPGNFDTYIIRFVGLPFFPKEIEAISNFKSTTPIKLDKNNIKYETTDQFGNNTTTVIKKLKELDGQSFTYIAFQKNYSTENTDDLTVQKADNIFVIKSVSFKDDIKGGEILNNFLRKLNL
jgi:hypothetical protein